MTLKSDAPLLGKRQESSNHGTSTKPQKRLFSFFPYISTTRDCITFSGPPGHPPQLSVKDIKEPDLLSEGKCQSWAWTSQSGRPCLPIHPLLAITSTLLKIPTFMGAFPIIMFPSLLSANEAPGYLHELLAQSLRYNQEVRDTKALDHKEVGPSTPSFSPSWCGLCCYFSSFTLQVNSNAHLGCFLILCNPACFTFPSLKVS